MNINAKNVATSSSYFGYGCAALGTFLGAGSIGLCERARNSSGPTYTCLRLGQLVCGLVSSGCFITAAAFLDTRGSVNLASRNVSALNNDATQSNTSTKTCVSLGIGMLIYSIVSCTCLARENNDNGDEEDDLHESQQTEGDNVVINLNENIHIAVPPLYSSHADLPPLYEPFDPLRGTMDEETAFIIAPPPVDENTPPIPFELPPAYGS